MELRIEYLPVGALRPYDRNARKHGTEDVSKIKKSIEMFGFSDPIGIWSEKNIIVEGHGRLEAAKMLGMDKVPVIRLDHMSDEQRREYGIAHNRTAEFSEWDIDTLTAELNELDFGDLDLGFDLNIAEEAGEAKEDDFDVEPPEKPVSKLGDIWQCGRHRLMCGDSTDADMVKQLCGDHEVDMLLTDPPYNVNYGNVRDLSEAQKLHKRQDGLVIKNDNMGDAEFRKFLQNAFTAADSVMKPGAVFYIWHADQEGYNFRGACRDVGWTVRECLIWNKNTFAMGRQDYHWKHEPCLYGWKEGAGHLWASDRKQSTVIDMPKPAKSELHPTMKPVPLFDYQMKNNTKGGDIVLDLFGGSGTAMIAAEQNGRTAYLMEYDPRYADVIIKRWESLTGERAVLIKGGADGSTTEDD